MFRVSLNGYSSDSEKCDPSILIHGFDGSGPLSFSSEKLSIAFVPVPRKWTDCPVQPCFHAYKINDEELIKIVEKFNWAIYIYTHIHTAIMLYNHQISCS